MIVLCPDNNYCNKKSKRFLNRFTFQYNDNDHLIVRDHLSNITLAHFHTSFTKRRSDDSSELTTTTREIEGNNETYKSIRSDGRRWKKETLMLSACRLVFWWRNDGTSYCAYGPKKKYDVYKNNGQMGNTNQIGLLVSSGV